MIEKVSAIEKKNDFDSFPNFSPPKSLPENNQLLPRYFLYKISIRRYFWIKIKKIVCLIY